MKRNTFYTEMKKSLDNEAVIDDYLIKKFKLNKKFIAHFKVARFRNKIPLLISFIILPAIPVYYLCQLVISLRSAVKYTMAESDGVFLSFSTSTKIKDIHRKYSPEMSLLQCVSGRRLLFVRDLSGGTIVASYIMSVAYYIRYIFSVHPKYHLHATSIFELVLFATWIKKCLLPTRKKITITNHYDRWATILSSRNEFVINIIQHGLLDKAFLPRHRLNYVESIRGFSDEQLDIFSKNICLHDDFQRLYLDVSISIDKEDSCSFFIVSNPFYIDFEISVYLKLKSDGVDVKFRPHPLYLDNKLLAAIAPEDLCLNERFPSPEYCLCRESTLGHEYQCMGYKIIWWDDTTTLEYIKSVIKE